MTDLAAPLSVAARYTRSVHIQRDAADIVGALTGYQVTPLVLTTTERIMAGIQPGSSERAFSITGPYGSGKSSYGLFLGHYLESSPHERQELIAKHAAGVIVDRPLYDGPRLLPVLVPGNNSSLRYALMRALYTTLTQRIEPVDGSDALITQLVAAIEIPDVDPQRVAELLEAATRIVGTTSHFDGLVIIVDELGQYLNYVVRQGSEPDLFVLQTVAEMAARSRSHPCAFITILHQAFDRYASTAGVVQRNEWSKVQGRFSDIPFQERDSQLLRMVGQALTPAADDPYTDARRRWAEYFAPLTETERLHMRPSDISVREWAELLAHTYPLHPTVLVALPQLFRQLAQNERSLFAFLSSMEPWGLQDVVRMAEQVSDAELVYRLPHLYAYVEASLGPSLFGRAHGRRWAELAEALTRASDIDELARDSLITIGTLGALSQSPSLRASAEHVAFALRDDPDAPDIQAAIGQLEGRQHITYRHHRKSFMLFEGSDLDLDALVQAAKHAIGDRMSLTALLEEHAQLTALVARRHSYETGAVRQFAARFVTTDELTKLPDISPKLDGEVLYVVPSDKESLQVAREWAQSPDRGIEQQRIVVLPQRVQHVQELLLEVGALQHVLAEQPELDTDRVAKRELASRLVEARQVLTEAITLAYAPAHGDWCWKGRVQPMRTLRDLDALLTQACNETFSATPRIWNELIMRRQLTSMSAKARRNLMEAMLDHAHEERLQIQGAPPERAIYESVFRKSGVHRQTASGRWEFGPPPNNDPTRLSPVWNAMQMFLDSTESAARPLIELYSELKLPPYGVKDGLMPLLFMTIYLANLGEVALYEHGNYVPVPDIAVFERLLRQPNYFAVRQSRVRGVRMAIYEHLAGRLQPKLLVDAVRPAIFDAVKPLLKAVQGLPEYSRCTHRVSQQAQSVRQAILTARAPDELLFETLPQACGLSPFAADVAPDEQELEAFFAALRTSLMELQGTYAQLAAEVAQRIQMAFSATTSELDRLQVELIERYHQIGAATTDTQIRAFGLRVENGGLGTEWVESVADYVGGKPLKSWHDSDVQAFEFKIVDLGRRFRAAEQLAVVAAVVPPATKVVRIGLTDQQGERSVVIRNGHRDLAMEHVKQSLATVLAQESSLTDQQRIMILAELLGPLLDRAQRSNEHDHSS